MNIKREVYEKQARASITALSGLDEACKIAKAALLNEQVTRSRVDDLEQAVVFHGSVLQRSLVGRIKWMMFGR